MSAFFPTGVTPLPVEPGPEMTDPCIDCKGTGRYVIERTTRVDIDSGLVVEERYHLCPECGGTGRLVPATPGQCTSVGILGDGRTIRCALSTGHRGAHNDVEGEHGWSDIPRYLPHPTTCRCDGKGYLSEPGTSRSTPCPEGRPRPSAGCPSTTHIGPPRITEDGSVASGFRRCIRAPGHDGYHSDDVIIWTDHGVTFTEPPSALPFCDHTLPETGLFPERRCSRIPGHIGLHSDGDLAWSDDGKCAGLDPVETVMSISAALDSDDDGPEPIGVITITSHRHLDDPRPDPHRPLDEYEDEDPAVWPDDDESDE